MSDALVAVYRIGSPSAPAAVPASAAVRRLLAAARSRRVDALAQRLRLFSHNRGNILSFHDADHGTRSGVALKTQIRAHLQAAGLAHAGHSIRLLCMPRVLGYVFNPLSIYFCYARRRRSWRALLYEVTNTFGERHSYLIATNHADRTVSFNSNAPRNSTSRRSSTWT